MIRNLTQGKPLSVLFFFALPMLLGNVFQQIYNIADSIIVGNYEGTDALAAVGGTFPVSFLAIAIATGASTGCSIVISQAFGAGDKKKVNKAISTSFIMVTLLGLAIMLSSFIFLEPLLKLLDTPKDIFKASYDYLRIIFNGCVFIFVYNCLTAIFNALGDSKTPLFFLIISTILNIILDLIFVAKLDMGTNGAGYATLIAQATATIGLSIFFFIKFKHVFNVKLRELFDTCIAKEMIVFAIPSVIQQTVVSIGMMAVQGLVNSFGTDFVAGYSASTKIDSIAVMPILNVSVALSTFTAQNIGARNFKRVKQGFNAAMIISVISAVICSIALIFFGRFFMTMFMDKNSSEAVLNYGQDYFRIVSLFYVVLALMFCANGVQRGLGNMRIFMATTVINIALRIGLAYAFKDWLGHKALFWALPIGWFVAGLISYLVFKFSDWQKKFE